MRSKIVIGLISTVLLVGCNSMSTPAEQNSAFPDTTIYDESSPVTENVLANDTDEAEFSYVDGKEMTISFNYGDRTGIYSGGVKNGLPHGIGRFSSSNSYSTNWEYTGEWENGHFNGTGTTVYESGEISWAEYNNDYMNGNGIIVSPKPSLYIGELNANGGNGHGTRLTLSDRYVGEFKDGHADGSGILYFGNGNRFEGEFIDQRINGSGIFYLLPGERVEGTFQENSETASISGSGTYYAVDNTPSPCTIADGQISIDGLFFEQGNDTSELP